MKAKTWTPAFAGVTTLISLCFTPLHADFLVGEGATGASFLKIPISARAAGMGGAFTAVTGDVAALEYNPAGLSEVYRADINATLISHIEDSKIQSASIAYPLSFTKGANLGDGFFGPDSNKVFLGFHYRGFEADDTARDLNGLTLGTIDIKDQLIQMGLAYAPFERLSLGLAGKFISSKIAGKSASTYAADAGIQWKLSAITTAGASLLNMGPDQKFITESDPLPTTLRTGLAFQFKRVLIATDLLSGRDKITQEAIGAEFKPNSVLKVRGGVVNGTSLDFAGGIGLQFSPSFSNVSTAERERKKNKNVLDELNVPEDNPVYKKYGSENAAALDFGIDYAIRTHEDLDVAHTITFRILY